MPPHDAPSEQNQSSAARSFREADLERRLQQATRELEALRCEQQALAHGLSHDLHAPVRAIDSFAWLLQRNTQLDAQASDQLRRIREASARMARLLERLQAFVNAGIAPLQSRQVDLSLLAEWIGAELQEAEPARRITLQVQPGLQAAGDERLLRTLLTQLLDNACRHSPGEVRIEISGGHDGDGTALQVRDHGSGFDMALAGKLGQPFQRLHADDGTEGSGLGLAIAQRIVARHGGSLRLESAPGAGTCVHVFLPAAQP